MRKVHPIFRIGRGMQQLFLFTAVTILGLVVTACGTPESTQIPAPTQTSSVAAQRANTAAPAFPSTYTCTRLNDPDRVEVRQGGNWIATFTIGSYTVALAGPSHTFSEPGASGISITHATWVRILPAPFQEPINETWLDAARNANTNNVPDVLQLGEQYIKDAPPIMDGNLQIAGDACYGPAEGADFHDYLGITWEYPSPEGTDTSSHLNSVVLIAPVLCG